MEKVIRELGENMKNDIMYYRKDNDFDCVYYENSTQSYPRHTHANHITLGYVLGGEVCIAFDNEKYIYNEGESYCIMPDMPHAIETVNNISYSMISMCISIHHILDEPQNEITCLKRLKQFILDEPENVFMIEDMAQKIGLSPYHMIRKFKEVCGLTPHQFQIQCKIRKAQRLLEEGKSVIEAAYGAGFCDQSHFDRCFHKIVKMTPSEYKQSVKRLV